MCEIEDMAAVRLIGSDISPTSSSFLLHPISLYIQYLWLDIYLTKQCMISKRPHSPCRRVERSPSWRNLIQSLNSVDFNRLSV
jgi:hypothetical protein